MQTTNSTTICGNKSCSRIRENNPGVSWLIVEGVWYCSYACLDAAFPRKRKHGHPEQDEQVAVAAYIRTRYPDILWTASAGGMRTSMAQAKKMKATGYTAGCPDIMIFEPRGNFHGLFIELKKSGGKGYATKEQKNWLEKAHKRNYLAVVLSGATDAINMIDSYLNNMSRG